MDEWMFEKDLLGNTLYMYRYGGYVSIADRPGSVLCVLVAY